VKRLPRILWNAATGLSLGLCIAIAYLWGTGYLLGWEGAWEWFHSDGLGYTGCYAEVSGGGIQLGWVRLRVSPNATPEFIELYRKNRRSPTDRYLRRTHGSDYPDAGRGGRWSFGDTSRTDPPYIETRVHVIVPCWLPVALTAMAPALWLNGRVRRWRNRKRGLCPDCGYDLRATPERCPECGRTPV
jgi:hypothetical protein